MEKKKVPEIRLEGFEGEWESCELKEIATFSKGTGYSKSDLVSAGNPIILYGRMYTNHETIISNVDTFAVPKKNSVYSRGGEVIVPASGESAEDISVASVVKNPNILLGGDLNIITPNKNIDPAFLALVISYGKAHDDMAKMAHGKTVVHLHNDDLEQVQFIHPQYDEQRAITNYIGSIDTTIKCQQERYTKLLVLKKSLRQKMFPQEGESVPRIRFEGFEGEWERVKFGDIVTLFEDKVETPTDGYFRLGIRSWAKGTFHTYVSAGEELSTAQMHRVSADKFIVNITFAWEHAVAITDENDAGKLVSHRFPQFSFQNDNRPKFFRYIISGEQFRQHLALSSPGGAGRNRVLDINEMLRYELRIPQPNEQQKIADYFDNLDTLIEAQEQKIMKLQQMKSALLQKMFV